MIWVIYEMLLRDFTASGDLNGAKAKLSYLKSLGVNAIELMPVQEFDGNDSWGYNPCFFFALDKAYGTDKMYKEFIDACHEQGIAVILMWFIIMRVATIRLLNFIGMVQE